MNITDITPAIMVKNEEYWIHYVLRDVLRIFPQVVMLDTGSTDATKTIALETAQAVGGNLKLMEAQYGNDAELIGNGRNVLRALVDTHWMFLIDGDEIWTTPQLLKLLAHTIPDGIKVVMGCNYNLEDVNGVVMERAHDKANKDILFSPDVHWTRTDYPFEGYGLTTDAVPASVVLYMPVNEVFSYHVRHTQRSSHKAYFREEKYGYFPYQGVYDAMPANWLHPIADYPNPYLRKQA